MSKAEGFKKWYAERQGHPPQIKAALEAIEELEKDIALLKVQGEKRVIRFALGTAYELSTMQTDKSYAGTLLEDAGISSSDELCAEVIEENESFSQVIKQFGL